MSALCLYLACARVSQRMTPDTSHAWQRDTWAFKLAKLHVYSVITFSAACFCAEYAASLPVHTRSLRDAARKARCSDVSLLSQSSKLHQHAAARCKGAATRTFGRCNSHIWRLQLAHLEAATRTFGGCNSHIWRLQLAHLEAATRTFGGCNSHTRVSCSAAESLETKVQSFYSTPTTMLSPGP